jgi:anti-sigma-K factor RskA
MIDERMEEQASLHVLGALSEAESHEFQKAMAADPELQKLVAQLSAATAALAGSVPRVEPPPRLRAKLFAQIESSQKIVPLPPPAPSPVSTWPWALAACLAILLAVVFAQDLRLRKTVQDQALQINQLDQLAQSLQSQTNELRRAVLALQETNRLVNLRVAMLNSLVPDAPKTLAVALWDNHKQNGVFVAQNLKALSTDSDYELWVFDENQHPVAAGVFQVDEKGNVKMDFKPSQIIKTAGMFAVTKEVKGGVSSPTTTNLVLAGN